MLNLYLVFQARISTGSRVCCVLRMVSIHAKEDLYIYIFNLLYWFPWGNCFSVFDPSYSLLTLTIHTGSSGLPHCSARGAVGGFGVLLKGPQWWWWGWLKLGLELVWVQILTFIPDLNYLKLPFEGKKHLVSSKLITSPTLFQSSTPFSVTETPTNRIGGRLTRRPMKIRILSPKRPRR